MKCLLFVFALIAGACAGLLPLSLHAPVAFHAPIAPVAHITYAAPLIGSSQYKAQDILGQYSYGYATANGISQAEARAIDGSVAGGYAYTGSDGKVVNIQYTAGPDGFKATGDAIPKAPAQTEEVAKATAEHLKAKEEAKTKAVEAPKEVAVAPLAIAPLQLAHPLALTHPLTLAHPLALASPLVSDDCNLHPLAINCH